MGPDEVIVTGRRFVLGETAEGYGIWDRRSAVDDPIEVFPLTEDGIELALTRFDELRREARRQRWNVRRVAPITAVIGVVTWVLAGTLAPVLFFGAGPWAPAVLYGLDALGFRLAVGSLIVLAVALLVGWARGSPGEPPEPAIGHGAAQTRFDAVLRVALVIGLVVWTLTAFATEALLTVQLRPFRGPETMVIVAAAVSELAFRVWISALIILVIRRLFLRGGPGEAAVPAQG